jgi:type II secretory pathway pseudopilin PulG
MTAPHGPDRLASLIINSTVTQMSSAEVLDQAYDLLQVAHAAIDRARSLQRSDVISLKNDVRSPAMRAPSNCESRGEIGKSAGIFDD